MVNIEICVSALLNMELITLMLNNLFDKEFREQNIILIETTIRTLKVLICLMKSSG